MTVEPRPEDFDTARQHRRGGTSASAAADAAKAAKLGDTHRKIWKALTERPRTADELAVDLRMVLNTARARCSDLLRHGWIERSGATRPTKAGKQADILRAIRKEVQT